MTSNAAKKARRRHESTALVHQTAADLVFKYGVGAALEGMSEMCKKKRRTYRTPEYRADVREDLEAKLTIYQERLPAESEHAGVEFEWGQPIILLQGERYVMVPWHDQGEVNYDDASTQPMETVDA